MTDAAEETVNGFDVTSDIEPIFYELTLFVSGASALAARAIANATRLCELHCNGHYHLSVVDIHEDPSSLLTNNLLATPTLVKSQPAPVRRVVGDLSQTDKVITTLDLPPAATDVRESAARPG
jgi:circadian clock protein KaiB